jgi:hypothetical protein
MATTQAPMPGDSTNRVEITKVPEEKRRRIFISYGHDETAPLSERIAPLPERLKTDLEARGHTVWLDVDYLKAGSNWMGDITKGLKQASRFVYLMTPHAVRDESFCLNEVEFACDHKLRIVPVLVINCERPLCIYKLQYLPMDDCVPCDHKEDRYRQAFNKLTEALELDFEKDPVFDVQETKLSDQLAPLDFTGDIQLHLPDFTGREWVFRAIDEWLDDSKGSRVFLLTGWAGTGKSAISAVLCHRHPRLKAFHVCVHSSDFKSNPGRCVKTIAYQLTTRFPEYRKRLLSINWKDLETASALDLFDQLIVTHFKETARDPGQPCFVLIDALDEATRNGQNELADFIGSHFEHGPEWLRLLVTTRPTDEVLTRLSKYDAFDLAPKRTENEDDIRAYTAKMLKELGQAPAVTQQAVDAIVARSSGIFLYAHWVCEDLKQGRLQLEQTATFPRGLEEVYCQFFDRLYKDGENYERVKPKLRVIAAAREPLPESVLNDIFKSESENAEDLDPLRPIFPCIDGRYRPFHKSVLDWLTDVERKPGAPERKIAGQYWISITDGQTVLADYCWSKCEPRVTGKLKLRDNYQTYPFRHGVHHLIDARRFANAVDVLDYLTAHSKEISADERSELDQLAKLVTLALGDEDHPPSDDDARRIAPEKLANLIAGLYMVEPLKGGIKLLLKHHREQWPALLEKLLKTDDYVVRHTIAEALADECLDADGPEQMQAIYALLDSSDLNRQELGAYAVQEVYTADTDAIDSKYLNRLANGEIYPFRSALGDLLIGRTLQSIEPKDLEKLDILQEVDPSSKFWNPIWDFNRMDISSLRAIDVFARGQKLPDDADAALAAAYGSLDRIHALRRELLDAKPPLPTEIKTALESYYELGVKPELIPQDPSLLKQVTGIEKIFEILFAYPLWDVTETAASWLASLVDEDPLSAHYISDLFNDELWRVRYGAAEAAFLARFRNNNRLFSDAIRKFYRESEPLLRGDIAENLAAWVLDTVPSRRVDLLNEFEPQLSYWISNEDEDAWILDHVYRLFHQLWLDKLDLTATPLANTRASSLIAGEPAWYTLDRQPFLLRIEDRKRARHKNV